MKVPLPNLIARIQQLQAQHHQRRITLLQARRRRILSSRTPGREDRARLRAFESADQRDELLDAGVVVSLEGRIGLNDGVGYVDYGYFHCLDLFLKGVVDAVRWDGGGEGCGGEGEEGGEEGGEVGELHVGGSMFSAVRFGTICMVKRVSEFSNFLLLIVVAVDVGDDER